MSFIKKNLICKKNQTVTKVKLVTKIKKHNQIYIALYCYCGDNG